MPSPPSLNRFENKLYDITHRPLFMITLFSSASMTVLGGAVVAPSIPALESHFASIPDIDFLARLVLTLPALFVMFFSPLSGILLDKWGRLTFLIPAMFVWSISGVLGALWDNIYWILATRAVFGIATAFVMTAASALVADYYFGDERQKALGLQGFGAACTSAIFISIGGVLAHYDWRYPFWVYGGGIILAILALFELFEPRKPKAMKKSVSRHESPQPSFSILSFIPIYFFGFMIAVGYYISPTQIPYFITQALGESESLVGISMSASAIAYGIASLGYARIRRALSVRMIYICGFLLMSFGFFVVFILNNFYSVSLGLLLLGIGGGVLVVNNSSSVLAMVPKEHTAKAMGWLSSMIFFGQFISPFFSQPLVRLYGITSLFAIISCVLFIMAILSGIILTLMNKRCNL